MSKDEIVSITDADVAAGRAGRRAVQNHHHRDVSGGAARAAVFGISDGLVSNVSLILAMAGGGASPSTVRLAGLAGLLAGAISMAAGEYVSMRAQTELVEREIAIEREAIAINAEAEQRELAAMYHSKGVSHGLATALAEEIHQDLELALETHAREELGVDPDSLGSAVGAATSSFAAFAAGAVVPLVPWFFTAGASGIGWTLGLGAVLAVLVGLALARFTGRSPLRSAFRQVVIAAIAAGVTLSLGALVGTGTV